MIEEVLEVAEKLRNMAPTLIRPFFTVIVGEIWNPVVVRRICGNYFDLEWAKRETTIKIGYSAMDPKVAYRLGNNCL